MEKLFKEKRLLQVQDFLNHLSNEWSDMTNKQIRYKFFKNSRSFTDEAIKILEENSIIEVDRATGKSYVDGKWIMNANRYRMYNGGGQKVFNEDSFFNQDKGLVKRFKYKGIYDVTETFTQEDKDLVKKVKEELCGLLDESGFVSICCSHGMSKEKAWYFYNKISQ